MPVYNVEFWWSLRGTPNSFYPLISVPEATNSDGSPANTPIVTSHSGLIPGKRYFYKSRREMIPDGPNPPVYSDFSPVYEAVIPFLPGTKGKLMEPKFGSGTILGWGIQPLNEPHDKPRQAQWIVENTSGKVRAELQTFASRALRNTTARRIKSSAGRALFPFSFPIEATPNGMLPGVMTSLFGIPTTTRVGGTLVTLGANVLVSATSMTVTALPAAIAAGSVLNFTVARTVTLTADAAAGDLALTVSAIPSAIPLGTVLNDGTNFIKVTANATLSATSLVVSALPVDLPSGTVLNYTQNRLITTSADAAASATTIAILAAGSALTSGNTALYGFKYRHEWKNQKAYQVGTFTQLIGDYVYAAPGAFVNQYEFNVDFDMDTVITPTIQGNALNDLNRYSLADAGLDIAPSDNLNAFTMIDALFKVNDVVSDDTKSVTVSVNRNGKPKGRLKRVRGVARHTPGITDITMTLNSFYTNEEFRQRYFGYSTDPGEPFGANCKIVYFSCSLEFASCPVLPGDLSYEMGVKFPKASIETDDNPVNGPDEIMEDTTVTPNWDSVTGTDAIFWIVCDQSLSDIMTPFAPITPVNANHVSEYVSA
jgi:hypothetical protein